MTKTPAPLLGFNNNVRHRGRIFHIQTEDSGVKSPRIVTHLFADGGRIVKTTRTYYAEHVGQKDMAPVVRKLMKEQHKAMFIALRAGELDQLLEQVCGPLPAETPSVAPPDRAVAEAPSPSKVNASPGPIPHPTPAIGSMVVADQPQSADAVTLANPALRRAPPAQQAPALEPAVEVSAGVLTATGTESPSPAAALGPGGEPPRKATPPPLPPRARQQSNPALTAVGATAVAATAPPASSKGRYAAPRPTTIFSQNAPDKQSLFGESVISEQSLDEVILSYLAEDLEAK